MRVVSHGLRVTPNAEFSVELPMANSSMFSRPKTIAPGRLQFFNDRRVVGRNEFAEDFRAAIERLVFDSEHVLDRNRNTQQRFLRMVSRRRQWLVGGIGLRQRVRCHRG